MPFKQFNKQYFLVKKLEGNLVIGRFKNKSSHKNKFKLFKSSYYHNINNMFYYNFVKSDLIKTGAFSLTFFNFKAKRLQSWVKGRFIRKCDIR